MNCVELRESLAEEQGTAAQHAHLRTCLACSALVRELDVIVAAARDLRGSEEPSPRVWNSIEAALRREGLIRPQRAVASSFAARWGAARWLVPAAAMLLIATGIYVRREAAPNAVIQQASVVAPATNFGGLDDDDLMQEVSVNAPAMKPQYQENLRLVNESIRDAQTIVDESPNDQEARRSLMDAYQQKAMLFEMAMDRSQP
jgi:hypothetical protein